MLCASLLAFACTDANEFGRVDQKDDSVPAPFPISVTDVRNTCGGAVIKIAIPDDNNLKGVIATYERNGVEVNTKISRYVDSLVVEGFADTEAHIVKVASFNINEVKSVPVEVTVNPLPPAIQTVSPKITESFGGLKILVSGNESKSDLAVCLLRCENVAEFDKPVADIKWVEVTTLFTASNNITLTRRNLEPVQAIYGVYFRDHWGNKSDTTKIVLTPLEEVQFPLSKYSYFNPGDDNSSSTNASYYPIQGLWDGSGASSTGHFYASNSSDPIPQWLTIDLGVRAKISRITTLPRIDYVIYSGAHPREYEFWGSMNPTGESNPSNEHGFDDSWFKLGAFSQGKPSGYEENGTVGTITAEDRDYFNAGNDFELDPVEYPDAYKELRYLRVVFMNTYSTYELHATVGQVQFGEVNAWGQILETYR